MLYQKVTLGYDKYDYLIIGKIYSEIQVKLRYIIKGNLMDGDKGD